MRGLCFLTRPLAASNEIGEDRGLETSLAEMRKVTDGDPIRDKGAFAELDRISSGERQ